MSASFLSQDLQDLADKATERAHSTIGMQSTMSKFHKERIRDLITCFTEQLDQSNRKAKQRIAFPLSTGVGKTVATTAFLTELILSGLYRSRSVVIATATIKELSAIADTLKNAIGKDLFDKAVGVFTSNASFKSPGDPSEYPIILMAHKGLETQAISNYYWFQREAVKGLKDEIMSFAPTPRDLIIWDEALVKATGFDIKLSTLAKASGALKLQGEQAIHTLLESFIDHLIKDENGKAKSLLPKLSSQVAVLGEPQTDQDIKQTFLAIGKFGSTENSLSVFRGHNLGETLIGWFLKIPDELERIVILDASSVLSALSRLDRSVEVKTSFAGTKHYSNVHITHYRHLACGKTIFNDRGLKQIKQHLEDAVDLIREIQTNTPGEKILLCTSKAPQWRKACFATEIKLWCEDAVLNMDLISFTHWGNHRAHNHWADHQHIIAVGVQRRNPHELAATAFGQSNGEGHEWSVKYLEVCEQAADLQQLIGRGTARRTNNGEAHRMHVYVFDKADFKCAKAHPNGSCEDLWQLIAPGAIVKIKGSSKAELLFDDIRHDLEELANCASKVSSSKLKKMLADRNHIISNSGSSKRLLHDIKAEAIRYLEGWEISKRGIEKSSLS